MFDYKNQNIGFLMEKSYVMIHVYWRIRDFFKTFSIKVLQPIVSYPLWPGPLSGLPYPIVEWRHKKA